MSAAVIVIVIIIVLGLIAVTQFNSLVRLNVGVDEAFAQIEVQLQRRSDLIPNLVETVKGYASHEKETFERVVNARAAATSAQGVAQVAAADGQLTQALRGLLAVAEAYPDLKASANFMALQEELAATENKVSFSRQYYNDNVRKLNATIKAIPGMWFTGIAKVSARVFYEVQDPSARQAPKVQF